MNILDWQINTVLERQHGTDAVMQALGYIPAFVSEDDPRPAHEQFNERYIYGGWNPMLPGRWRMDQDFNLFYPGDPPMQPLAQALCHGERIVVYPRAFVAIVQTDGIGFSVARMD